MRETIHVYEEHPRILPSAIDESDPTASLELAFEVLEYFDLRAEDARTIASEVGRVVSCWRQVAKKAGLADQEIDRMASAFEHRDMDAAKSLRS